MKRSASDKQRAASPPTAAALDPGHQLSAGPDWEAMRVVHEYTCRLLRRVPDVQCANTAEEKLRLAAQAVLEESPFASCSVFVEHSDVGLLLASAGDGDAPPGSPADRYAALRARMDESGPKLVASGDAEDRERTPEAIIPIRSHDGRITGVADLVLRSGQPGSPEILAVVESFLRQAALSVDQLLRERDLQKSRATYRALIDNVGDVIFRLDREGRITFVSRQVINILGLPWHEVLGKSASQFVRDRDLPRMRQVVEEILGGRAVSRDLTVVRPDGSEMVLFVSANPILEAGVVAGILGIGRDVTEKRKLEEQISQSERRYRALTENANDAIFLVDPDTTYVVDINPQAEHLTGYSRAELLRMSVADLRRPHERGQVRERIRSVMAAGPSRFEDVPIVRKDGSEVFVDTAASVYEIEGKRYYQAILRDMTAQKAMTEALSSRVMELQILSEVSDALQSSVDLQSVMGIVLTGVTAGKGLGFNRALIFSYDKVNNELRGEAALGPRSAEEAGQIWADLESKGLSLTEILEEKIRSFPRDADASFEFARQFEVTLDDPENVFAKAIRNRETIRVSRNEGDLHLPPEFLHLYGAHEFAIVPLVTRDDVMGVLLVDNLFTQRPIQDHDLHRLKLFANSAASAIERSRLLISLEKRLHELMLTNQDLKASRDRLIKTERLSAIGEVAASVAHEIRNPLTAIGGFARSIYGSLNEKDKNRRKLQIILDETDRLEHMLSALLEFTRPAVPRFTDLDLNALAMQTIHFMGTEINPELVHVVYRLDPHLPRTWADSQQMRQVLLNIIRNALQEMSHGGTLTISTWEEGGEVRLSVQDTGPGIAPENLDKIFEAFYTTKPSGSGLGLAICAQIVRNHNGRVEVSSQPGAGATFVVALPVAQKALDSY